jgi:hypothetical protein
MTTTPVQEQLSALTMRGARRAFSGLPAPLPADLVGRWDGAMVGRPGLQRLSRAVAALGPLRGWCGKHVEDTGLVHNLVRRGGNITPATDCWVSSGGSLLDGRAALVADYSRTAAPPVKWLRGEMRWLVPGEQILGMLVLPVGRRLIGPFPFQMTRSSQ